nr:helix-turn-helix domain-containing protein [uncultured Streptomyces sp.]
MASTSGTRPASGSRAKRFTRGEKTAVIARDLRVSERSVERWRPAWREGGVDSTASTGPTNVQQSSQSVELGRRASPP